MLNKDAYSVNKNIHLIKSHAHTCDSTFARTRNVIDNISVNNAFSMEIMFILKAIKSHFKDQGHVVQN